MILIIDDVEIFREPIAACLRLAGFETTCAPDGVEGLKKAKELKPELILLDMAMPRMDGISFLRALRDEPALREVPVIALTAVSAKEYVNRAKDLNVCEYLLKSRFRAKELIERVRSHLGQSSRQPTSA